MAPTWVAPGLLFLVAIQFRITSKSVSGITSKGITSKIQCFKIGNEHDMALDVIPALLNFAQLL